MLRLQTKKCANCGEEFETSVSRAKYCGASCGYKAQYSKKIPEERRYGRVCPYCGDSISDSDLIYKVYCTKSCQAKSNAAIRRARRRKLPSERISRHKVFKRDNYTCHLCMKPVVDGRPVIDHIIPLAVDGSPGHVWENVATAHAKCNFSKNARVRPEDYDLYVRLSLGGSVVT